MTREFTNGHPQRLPAGNFSLTILLYHFPPKVWQVFFPNSRKARGGENRKWRWTVAFDRFVGSEF